MKLKYFFYKILAKMVPSRKYSIMNNYYRKSGAIIGKNCAICSNLDLCDGYCLEIKNDVIISSDVLFVTHDASASRLIKRSPSFWGRIVIGNNCFIGKRSTIMYGVTLADNVIVAAGSVVTKSFLKSNIIIAGNPARIIGDWDSLILKSTGKGMDAKDVPEAIKNNDMRLIERSKVL